MAENYLTEEEWEKDLRKQWLDTRKQLTECKRMGDEKGLKGNLMWDHMTLCMNYAMDHGYTPDEEELRRYKRELEL